MIYLDWAATGLPQKTADAHVDKKWFANPSSPHPLGRMAASTLATTRSKLAKSLKVDSEEIIFTAGATESNNLMLQSILTLLHPERGLPRRDTLVISSVEHDSIEKPAALLARLGFRVRRTPVGPDGLVDIENLLTLIDERTYIVSIQSVNNETGVIQPVNSAASAVSDASRRIGTRIIFHTDAVQALGKLPLPLGSDVHAASFSAHKIGGPRGVGALWLRSRTPVQFMQAGGEQEGGRRAGTENVNGAINFESVVTKSSSIITKSYVSAELIMARLIDQIANIPNVVLIPADRLPCDRRFSPFILKLSVPTLPSEVTVRLLGDRGFCISPGSACSTGSRKRLRVLEAMGVPPEQATGAVRVSIGPATTIDEIDLCSTALAETVRSMTDRTKPLLPQKAMRL